MITLGLFMIYQIYQVAHAHSVVIAVLTLFDVLLMWLIYREYQIQLAKHTSAT